MSTTLVLSINNAMDISTGSSTFQELFLEDGAPVQVMSLDDWNNFTSAHPQFDEAVRGDIATLWDWLSDPDHHPCPPTSETLEAWEAWFRNLCEALIVEPADTPNPAPSPYPDLGLGDTPITLDMSNWGWSERERPDGWKSPEIATSNPLEGLDLPFRMAMFIVAGVLIILSIPFVTAGITVNEHGELLTIKQMAVNVAIGVALAGAGIVSLSFCVTGRPDQLPRIGGFWNDKGGRKPTTYEKLYGKTPRS